MVTVLIILDILYNCNYWNIMLTILKKNLLVSNNKDLLFLTILWFKRVGLIWADSQLQSDSGEES